MKKNQLLFVTYHDENFEDGLSYALDLAKTMNNGIEILLLYKRKVFEKIEDMMMAISFAESGEHRTARELISEDYKTQGEDYEKKVAVIKEKCSRSGIAVDFSAAAMDAISAIKNILKQNMRIDMVLLSPSVTKDGNVNAKMLNKLVKTAARPIVTMAKQSSVA